jgi:hypothetical protein
VQTWLHSCFCDKAWDPRSVFQPAILIMKNF